MGDIAKSVSDDRAVYVVDDDDSVRNGIAKLLFSEGYSVRTFDSAEAFLEKSADDQVACIVLDLQMPGLSGLELQQYLLQAGRNLPIVFVTGHGGVPDSVQAMKYGAVDFLPKPFPPDALLSAVAQAIEKGQQLNAERKASQRIQDRVAQLTPREYEVMQHVITGSLNKQIAAALNISEKTVKIHRARVMDKMDVASVAELVRDTARIGIEPVRPEKD